MKEFRIVAEGGGDFKVQKRRLWWWVDVREPLFPPDHRIEVPPLMVIKRFKSPDEAHGWVLAGAKGALPHLVVRNFIVP